MFGWKCDKIHQFKGLAYYRTRETLHFFTDADDDEREGYQITVHIKVNKHFICYSVNTLNIPEVINTLHLHRSYWDHFYYFKVIYSLYHENNQQNENMNNLSLHCYRIEPFLHKRYPAFSVLYQILCFLDGTHISKSIASIHNLAQQECDREMMCVVASTTCSLCPVDKRQCSCWALLHMQFCSI